jgi:hypothetical protein
MRHLKNRSLEKCLLSYQFINLKLFHPERRNFDQNDLRFLDTGEKILFSRFEIIVFSISPMPALYPLTFSHSPFMFTYIPCLTESVCLSFCLFVYMLDHLSAQYMSICMSFHLSVRSSVLSARLSVYLGQCVFLTVYIHLCVSVYASVCLPICSCLFLPLYVSPSIC